MPTDPEANPWTIKSSEERYANPWIKIVESQVLRPDGQPGIYGVVDFVHTAVGVVPLAENGDTWLVGQYRFPLDTYEWEIPEGGGKPDETPLSCAQRELAEETGITAASWEPLIEGFQLSNSTTNEIGHVFLARDLTIGDATPDGDEQLQISRLPLTEAIDLALEGKIHDSLSVAALFKLRAIGLA